MTILYFQYLAPEYAAKVLHAGFETFCARVIVILILISHIQCGL